MQHQGKTVYLHRLLMGSPERGWDVDHLNGDLLDNRKENLRVVSHAENICNMKLRKDNTSGYRGVFCKGDKWWANIFHRGKRIGLGLFDTPEEANVVRLLKEQELWGIQPQRLVDFQEAGLT